MKELENGEWIENPDKPDRIESIRNAFEKEGFLIVESREYNVPNLFHVHDPVYVNWLREKSESIEVDREYFPEVFGYDMLFDTGTPITRGCYVSALGSVSTVLSSTQAILEGQKLAYALCRPPGHHAGISTGGGYCYFNNAALAAKYYQKYMEDYFVAILDIDFHHGNGTQEIFYHDDTVLYVSIHGDPKVYYPWISGNEWEIGADAGEGFNMNFPVAGGIKGKEYMKVLNKALQEVDDFSPNVLIVSFGIDTHEEDHVGHFSLQDEDYLSMGKLISQIAASKIIVQEGGYNPAANARAAIKFIRALT
jgi:acetoin utilization deacetylase AcuC-like enzyme